MHDDDAVVLHTYIEIREDAIAVLEAHTPCAPERRSARCVHGIEHGLGAKVAGNVHEQLVVVRNRFAQHRGNLCCWKGQREVVKHRIERWRRRLMNSVAGRERSFDRNAVDHPLGARDGDQGTRVAPKGRRFVDVACTHCGTRHAHDPYPNGRWHLLKQGHRPGWCHVVRHVLNRGNSEGLGFI